MKLHYHPGKANVIADALSWKSYANTLVTGGLPRELAEDFRELRLEIVPRGFVTTMEVQSTLLGKIREAQKDDKEIVEIKEKMSEGKAKGFREDEHDSLWFEDRVYVPNNAEIRKLILHEAHDSPYSIHPGNTKMYLDLKEHFWWTGMKKDIAEYVAVCDVCQRVKAEHQKPAGFKDGNGSGLDWVEQYQIHIHIHEDSLCPPMKESMGEKLCPCPNPMDIHIHWIYIGSSHDM